MASEPSEENVVTATLSADMTNWLDERAAELDVDEETLVVQLLASYRAAEELGDDPAAMFDGEVEAGVRDVVADRIPDIARAVEDHLDAGGDDLAAVEDHVEAEVDRLEREVADAESSFQSKLEDVRERVIQVKKAADAKAPADHTHPELDDVATLRAELEELGSRVSDLGAAVEGLDDRVDDLANDVEDQAAVESRLSDAEEKLERLAWAVSDLRETQEAYQSGTRAIDRLKRTAAEKDVERALCDNCDQPVDIALLSEPKCPHCEATVNDVRLPSGFFGKPRLSVARQLEAGTGGDTRGDTRAGDSRRGDSNVPDAARR